MSEKGKTKFDEAVTETASSSREGRTRSLSPFFIVIEGGAPGALLSLRASGTALGRSVENSLQLIESSISRKHAWFEADLGMSQSQEAKLTDLSSTNGTFVNGILVPPGDTVVLRDSDRVQFGSGLLVKFAWLDEYEERFHREMFDRMVRDSLTGLLKRDHFLELMRAMGDRVQRLRLGIAGLMVDIDHFKAINDGLGHDVGDEVLREVARLLQSEVGPEELAGRYGGEEFVLALAARSLEEAVERGERIRAKIADAVIVPTHPQAGGGGRGTGAIRATVSVGVSFLPGMLIISPSSISGLISRADQCLLDAKSGGRNRVIAVLSPSVPDRSAEPAEPDPLLESTAERVSIATIRDHHARKTAMSSLTSLSE